MSRQGEAERWIGVGDSIITNGNRAIKLDDTKEMMLGKYPIKVHVSKDLREDEFFFATIAGKYCKGE